MNGSLRFWTANEAMNQHPSPTTPCDMDEAAAAAVAAARRDDARLGAAIGSGILPAPADVASMGTNGPGF